MVHSAAYFITSVAYSGIHELIFTILHPYEQRCPKITSNGRRQVDRALV